MVFFKLVYFDLETLLNLRYLLSISPFSLDWLLDLHLSSATILEILFLKLFYEFFLHFQFACQILDIKLLLGEFAFKLD